MSDRVTVVMLHALAGPGVSVLPREEYVCPRDEAERLIAKGAARWPEGGPAVERAVAPPPAGERATTSSSPARRSTKKKKGTP